MTGPATAPAASVPASLSFGDRGGIVMRSPSSSTDRNRFCLCSIPSRPPVTSKWRTSMNGEGFFWFLSRSFRPSPWMRNSGNVLTPNDSNSTSALSFSCSSWTSASRSCGARETASTAIQSPTSTPAATPITHRMSFMCRRAAVENRLTRASDCNSWATDQLRWRAMYRVLLAAALLLVYPAFPTAQAAPPDLDAWVQRALKTFEVPGLSLAIVKDGAVVVARGYGVRKLGEPAPVDEKTLFGIASNTKAFTATALGILVDEGRIRWDAPVIDYVPLFQLSDPDVTREITVRDLLVHRSGLGLGAGDLMWWPASTYDRKEIMRRLRYLPLSTSFRSAYAYDNVLYLVAGEIIEAVSGRSWEDFVQSRILAKVGMTTSNVRHSDATKAGNVATRSEE